MIVFNSDISLLFLKGATMLMIRRMRNYDVGVHFNTIIARAKIERARIADTEDELKPALTRLSI